MFAASGQYAGTRVFEDEEAKGFALMHALSPAQQQEATVATDLPTEVFAAAFRDNLTLTCQGIRYERLTQDQQAMLVDRLDDNCGKLRSAAGGLSCRKANGGNSHDRHACPLEARRSR
jgi:hypothetical protein